MSKLTAPDGANSDNFGLSVAVSGSTIVVGARYDDDNGGNSGSAYIFDPAGQFVSKLTAPDGAGGDYFGVSVAVDGSKIVVGAHLDDDNGGFESGSVYIFNTSGQFVSKLTAPDATRKDYFGFSVAVDGSTIVAGAYQDDDNGSNSGSAYVFS